MLKNKILIAALFSFSLTACTQTAQAKEQLSPQQLVTSLNNAKVQYQNGNIIIYPDVDVSFSMAAGIISGVLGGISCAAALSDASLLGGGISLCLISILFFTVAKIKHDVRGSKPMVIISSDGITYQNCGVFWDSKINFVSWEDVKKFHENVKTSWIHFSGYEVWEETKRDYVIKTDPAWKSVTIPGEEMPVSFDSFCDLLFPYKKK